MSGTMSDDALVAVKEAKRRHRRLGASKVKTGCITCKIRRVKCDETKPICTQCASRQVLCEGYAHPGIGAASTAIVGGHHALVNHRPPSLSPEAHIFSSEDEYRAFTSFETSIAKQLANSLPGELWESLCLQLCQGDAALKNTCMALGTMGRTMQVHKTAGALRRLGEDDGVQQARRYYGQALVELRRKLNGDGDGAPTVTLETTLSSLLLTIFEFLHGDETSSTAHVVAADRMVHHLTHASRTCTTTTTETKAYGELHYSLQKILAASSHWRDTWTTTFNSLPDLNVLYTAPLPPPSSDNLYDLHRQLELVRLAIWNVEVSGASGALASNKCSILSYQVDTIMAEADRVAHRLNSPLNHVRRDVVHVLGCIARYQLQRLSAPERFNAASTSTIDTSSSSPSAADDDCEGSFDTLLDLTHRLLTTQPKLLDRVIYELTRNRKYPTLQGLEPLFNFVSVLIEPLFLVATRTRDVAMRTRALELLKMREWREGAWDSSVVVGMVERRVGRWIGG